jgi:hypothetical protein
MNTLALPFLCMEGVKLPSALHAGCHDDSQIGGWWLASQLPTTQGVVWHTQGPYRLVDVHHIITGGQVLRMLFAWVVQTPVHFPIPCLGLVHGQWIH